MFDLQEMLNKLMAASRHETLKSSPQMTLGEAIAVLESSELTFDSEGKKPDKLVVFDFEYVVPTGIDSWRGSYDELAINFDATGTAPTATEFLDWLREALGKTFTGYKGGEYTMGKNTPLWVANYGNSGSTGLVGIRVDDYEVKLFTWECEL